MTSTQRLSPLLAIIASLVYLVVTSQLDWLDLNDYGLRVWAIRLTGACLVGALVFFLSDFLFRSDRRGKVVFTLWLILLGTFLLMTWPGLAMSDSYAAYKAARSFPVDSWLGYGYVVWNSIIFQLAPEFWAISCANIILASWLLSRADELFCRTTRLAPILLHGGVLLCPSLIFSLLLLSRDTIFALCLGFVLLNSWPILRRGRGSFSSLIALGLQCACVIAIRSDGALAIAVLLFGLILRSGARASLVTAATLTASLLVANMILPRVTGEHRDHFAYEMSLTLNPLGYILQREYSSKDKAKLEETINRVVDVPLVKRISVPSEIPVLWSQGLKPNSTLAERNNYVDAYKALIFDNPGLFIQGRIETFMGSTGLADRTLTFVASDISGNWQQLDRGFYNDPQPIVQDVMPAIGSLRAKAMRALSDWGQQGRENRYRALTWGFLPHLFILLFLLFSYKKTPATAICSAILLSRVPALFLLQPASHFKYYLFLVLGTYLLLAASVYELHEPLPES